MPVEDPQVGELEQSNRPYVRHEGPAGREGMEQEAADADTAEQRQQQDEFPPLPPRLLPVAAVAPEPGDEGGDEGEVAEGVERLGPEARIGPLAVVVDGLEPVGRHAGSNGGRLLFLTRASAPGAPCHSC